MANQNAKRDENRVPNLLAITDDESQEIRRVLVEPTSGRILMSAVLDAGAVPALTEAQRNGLTPSAGWIIFNTDDSKLQVYTGSGWETITST